MRSRHSDYDKLYVTFMFSLIFLISSFQFEISMVKPFTSYYVSDPCLLPFPSFVTFCSQDSKRSFLHNIVNEEGENEKIESFVNFCEDSIFEVITNKEFNYFTLFCVFTSVFVFYISEGCNNCFSHKEL